MGLLWCISCLLRRRRHQRRVTNHRGVFLIPKLFLNSRKSFKAVMFNTFCDRISRKEAKTPAFFDENHLLLLNEAVCYSIPFNMSLLIKSALSICKAEVDWAKCGLLSTGDVNFLHQIL